MSRDRASVLLAAVLILLDPAIAKGLECDGGPSRVSQERYRVPCASVIIEDIPRIRHAGFPYFGMPVGERGTGPGSLELVSLAAGKRLEFPGTYSAFHDAQLLFTGWYMYTGFNLDENWDGSTYSLGRHPGEDWNGKGGGATDRGEPVFAVAPGIVIAAGVTRNFGISVAVVHRLAVPGDDDFLFVSFYGHLDQLEQDLSVGEAVLRDSPLGTLGNTGPRDILPHLHFEIRRGSSFLLPVQIGDVQRVQLQDRGDFKINTWPASTEEATSSGDSGEGFIAEHYCQPSTLLQTGQCVGRRFEGTWYAGGCSREFDENSVVTLSSSAVNIVQAVPGSGPEAFTGVGFGTTVFGFQGLVGAIAGEIDGADSTAFSGTLGGGFFFAGELVEPEGLAVEFERQDPSGSVEDLGNISLTRRPRVSGEPLLVAGFESDVTGDEPICTLDERPADDGMTGFSSAPDSIFVENYAEGKRLRLLGGSHHGVFFLPGLQPTDGSPIATGRVETTLRVFPSLGRVNLFVSDLGSVGFTDDLFTDPYASLSISPNDINWPQGNAQAPVIGGEATIVVRTDFTVGTAEVEVDGTSLGVAPILFPPVGFGRISLYASSGESVAVDDVVVVWEP